MAGILNVVLVSLLTTYGADAAGQIRGSHQMLQPAEAAAAPAQPAAQGGTDWASLGLGVGIGAVVAAIIAGVALKAVGGAAPKEGEETGEKEEGAAAAGAEETAAPVEEEEEAPATDQGQDFQALVKVLAQKVAQEVGPKLSKAGAVKNVLDSRMTSFTDKAKSFLLNEMNGAAGSVLRELDAPEAMMLLDWNHAVEANFPPASILIAGVLSPTVINLMSIHHLIQMVSVGLPILILCICAIYIDWAAPCAIPTIFPWLFTQTALAAALVIGHGALLVKVFMGKSALAAKAQEVNDNKQGESLTNVRDEFVGNTIILQEALLVENGIRHSFWNSIVGVATFAWVITTIWNLVLICGWTFVPGVVAFHPDAAEVAKDEYCGAWMTVLVLRINMLLAVLFLFLNLATVVQWVCDMMIESQGFQQSVLKQAQEMDRGSSGLPVMELLVKAFLLRGGTDTLNNRLAVVQGQKASLEKEKADLAAKLAAIDSEITSVTTEEQTLKATAEEMGGHLAEQVSKLTSGGADLESWKSQGDKALSEAEAKARQVQEATTQALEELWEKISQVVEAAQNSETAKALAAKYHELEAKFEEAMNTLQDPAFQQQLKEAAEKASAQARDLADQAIQAAKDPEMQKKLNQMAHDAMEQAQKAAEEVAAAANDPEKRKQLQEAAQKAMDQAKATAQKAADGLNDPEMQKKMKEAAQNAMNQAQLAADSAIAAAQDPELQKKLKEAAQKAMDDAKAAAKQAQEAANDPEKRKELEAAAKKMMQEAKDAAEKAKAAAQDPEMQKRLTEAAQKYKQEAQAQVEETAKQATEAVKKAAKKLGGWGKKKAKKSEGKFFSSEAASSEMPAEKKSGQKKLDEPVVKSMDAVIKSYMQARFSLTANQYPHEMKF